MAARLVVMLLVTVAVREGLCLPSPRGQGWEDQLTQQIYDYLAVPKQRAVKTPQRVPDWPRADLQLGQVSGVDVTSDGDVIVFHRGARAWTGRTFDMFHNLAADLRVPIAEDVLVRLDSQSGDIVDKFGANSFYLPHGVTLDKENNFWLTDVGSHQVFRIPHNQTEPDLILGEKFVPGSDDTHFCKPTDVAVASNGEFFVSDGYCNSRVLKFSKEGTLLGKFGMNEPGAAQDSPYSMDVPHSLALIEHLDILCVADRENQRALCFKAGLAQSKLGQFDRTLVPGGDIGRVFALVYSQPKDVVYVARAEEPVSDGRYTYSPARVFTYSLNSTSLAEWDYITPMEAIQGPSIPHDIALSPDGNYVYVADVLQRKVTKFDARMTPSLRKHIG